MNLLTEKFCSLKMISPERSCSVLSLTPRFSGVHEPRRIPNHFSGFLRRLETAEAVQSAYAPSLIPLKRGVNEKRSTPKATYTAEQFFGLFLALSVLLICSTVQAQNDGADAVSNAVVEAATTIVSNAMVQLSEGATTNDVASNDITQAATTVTDTNVIDTNNLPGSPQPGPLESRRQWLLRQRAGNSVANDAGGPNERSQTNAAADAIFRPAKPEFSAFKLVNDRNIFDPNRVPHRGAVQPAPKITKSFGLVGVMSYEKGTFAFFDGTDSEFTKAVKVNDSIAGYKITRIEPNSVNLLTGTNRVQLQIGMQLRREEGGNWVPSAQSEIYAPSSSSNASVHSDSNSSSADNDILERLRKKREQE